MTKQKKIVVIGGGTGIYPVVSALRSLPTECTSIINASDSGGSTGRIRDEFGFPPVGDLRQSLAAMADPTSQHWIRELLLYRFTKGEGLAGHNLGNLMLTALQDMTGSTTEALAIAAKVLRISGRVVPITESDVQLEVVYDDDSVLRGEHLLDEVSTPHKRVKELKLIPEPTLNTPAADCIKTAEFCIIGPGDYYASLLSVLLVPGVSAVFATSKARTVYFVNLMTRSTQTKDMTAKQHVQGIERALGKKLDHIVINTGNIPKAVLDRYASQDESPVVDDLGDDKRVVRTNLVSTTTTTSLLRHDELKVGSCLQKLLHL